jgi:hypothetical protein
MRTSSRYLFLAALAGLTMLFTSAARAQMPCPNGTMMGTNHSGGAIVSGADAIGVNPALIEPAEQRRFSLSLVPFSVQAGSDFFHYDTYLSYFTGKMNDQHLVRPRYLTTEDKQALLAGFEGDVGTIRTDDQFRLFGATVAIGSMAFGVDITDRMRSTIVLPKAMAEFLLFGNTPGRTFELSTTQVQSSWIRDYGITVAREFPMDSRRGRALFVGATVKYLQGFGYFGIDRFNSSFTTDPDSFVISGRADLAAMYAGTEWIMRRDMGQFSLFPDPVGSGFGFDLGAQLRVSEYFAIGAAFTDFGWMTWDRSAYQIDASEDFTLSSMTADDQITEVTDRLNHHEHPVSSFSSSLPAAVTVSGAFSLPSLFGRSRALHLTFAMREGLSDDLGNSTSPRFAAGTEARVASFFALRLGAAFGGFGPATAACGVSLRMQRLTVDVATNNIESLLSRHFSVVSFAVSGRLDF